MKSTLLLMVIFHSLTLTAQQTTDWLKENVIPISTTDQYINSSKEFEPLKKLLAGKDIILLGEEDHVFSTTFESKTKLIKFLHDELGFNVLAFEMDIYALSRAYHKSVKEKDPLILANSLYGFWGRVKSTESLFPYIVVTSHTGNALKVVGMDCQSTSFYSLPEDIDSLLFEYNSPILKYSYYPSFKKLFKKVYLDISRYQYKLSDSERLLLFEVFDDIFFEIDLQKVKTYRSKVLHHSLVNFKYHLNNVWQNQPSNYNFLNFPIPADSVYGFVSDRRSMNSQNRRDKMMADNICWLKETLYPNEKIIVWAASEHSMYNRHEASFHNFLIDTSFAFHGRFKYNKGYKSMGTYVKEYFGNKVYSLGFTSLTGQVNFDRSGANSYMGEIITADNSLESFLVKLATPNGILDFNKKGFPASLRSNNLFHNFIGGAPNTSGDITRFFDGIYFIRTMRPLEFLKR